MSKELSPAKPKTHGLIRIKLRGPNDSYCIVSEHSLVPEPGRITIYRVGKFEIQIDWQKEESEDKNE
jgi:hypothetical protein